MRSVLYRIHVPGLFFPEIFYKIIYRAQDIISQIYYFDMEETLKAKTGKPIDDAIKFPQKATPLRIQIYEYLRDSIVRGILKTGEMYSEQQISSIFGTSKTPVREALLQLNNEGLLEYYQNRGIKIKDITDKDVREIFEMRCVLESFVVESLAKKGAESTIKQAEELLEIQKKLIFKDDKIGWISTNVSFHMLLVNAFGNGRIANAVERFSDDIQRMGLELISNSQRMQEVFLEHEKIVNALKKRNSREAREAIYNHLKKTESLLLAARGKNRPTGKTLNPFKKEG